MGLYHLSSAVKKREVRREPVRQVSAPHGEVKVLTGVDRLYRLLEVSGSVELGKIPDILGVSLEQVELWIRLLEEQGIVAVHYPPLGGSVVRLVRREDGSS